MHVPALRINSILEDWATITPPIENFTVENVLYAANLDESYYGDVFKYLMRLQGYMLNAVQIVLCPNNHKCHIYKLDEPINYEEVYECWCSEDEFEPDNVLIAFQFAKEFIDECKKKSVINKSILQLV
ncbi:hypothetical protein [Ectobacillus antri]|uniref:hypothetical protein n=1 Tax=Ectobacillus antri TaxID=2486280 RepID=UPI000F5B0D8E|nr:hypothetical protein [Ectobacillus antri]